MFDQAQNRSIDRASLVQWRERSARVEAESEESMEAEKIRAEALMSWLAWLLQGGPAPHDVMRRLVAMTRSLAPWISARMTARELRAIAVDTSDSACLRSVLGVRLADVSAILAKAYRAAGHTWDRRDPETLNDQLRREDFEVDEVEKFIRSRALVVWITRLWAADGVRSVSLATALKNLYVEARCFTPELLLNMSGEQIAALVGQGRAAESARVKRQVNDPLRRAGFHDVQMRFQKAASTCRLYAAAQKGNRHRANSVRRESAA